MSKGYRDTKRKLDAEKNRERNAELPSLDESMALALADIFPVLSAGGEVQCPHGGIDFCQECFPEAEKK